MQIDGIKISFYRLMNSPIWIDIMRVGWFSLHINSRGHCLQLQNLDVLQSLKFDLILANNEDPDEMLHIEAFNLGLKCLLKLSFTGVQYT